MSPCVWEAMSTWQSSREFLWFYSYQWFDWCFLCAWYYSYLLALAILYAVLLNLDRGNVA